MMPMLYARGMRVWPSAQVTAIGDGSVTIAGETGCDLVIACDAVVEAMDMLPNDDMSAAGVAETYVVGDANAPFNIAEAIAAGNLCARKL